MSVLCFPLLRLPRTIGPSYASGGKTQDLRIPSATSLPGVVQMRISRFTLALQRGSRRAALFDLEAEIITDIM